MLKILPEGPKSEKPTVGFQTDFFVMVWINANFCLATVCNVRIPQKMKNHKKSVIFFRADGPFSAKTP
jgi:hypothetical protein